MTKLSIIIPVYNCKEYLAACVESVLKISTDSGKAFVNELILVDDGSTDGSSELCDEIAANLSRDSFDIRVIHQENTGVSAARNAGLKAATGTYVLFVDSDDAVNAELLAGLMKTIDTDITIDMAVFGMSFDYYNGDKIYRSDAVLPPAEGKKSLEECRQMLYELFERNSLSALWNKVIKKSVIEENGILLCEDMFLYEDLEFSLRALAKCGNVYFLPEAIYRYRQAADGGNAGRRLKRIEHIQDLIGKIEAALNDLGNDKEKILVSLYLTLAREKISVVEKEEIDIVCSDFKSWIDGHKLLPVIEEKEYAMLIYNGQTAKLISRRRHTKIRHAVANWIKQNIGDFRKW